MSNLERAYLERALDVLERICAAVETIAGMEPQVPAPLPSRRPTDVGDGSSEIRPYVAPRLPGASVPDVRYPPITARDL